MKPYEQRRVHVTDDDKDELVSPYDSLEFIEDETHTEDEEDLEKLIMEVDPMDISPPRQRILRLPEMVRITWRRQPQYELEESPIYKVLRPSGHMDPMVMEPWNVVTTYLTDWRDLMNLTLALRYFGASTASVWRGGSLAVIVRKKAMRKVRVQQAYIRHARSYLKELHMEIIYEHGIFHVSMDPDKALLLKALEAMKNAVRMTKELKNNGTVTLDPDSMFCKLYSPATQYEVYPRNMEMEFLAEVCSLPGIAQHLTVSWVYNHTNGKLEELGFLPVARIRLEYEPSKSFLLGHLHWTSLALEGQCPTKLPGIYQEGSSVGDNPNMGLISISQLDEREYGLLLDKFGWEEYTWSSRARPRVALSWSSIISTCVPTPRIRLRKPAWESCYHSSLSCYVADSAEATVRRLVARGDVC